MRGRERERKLGKEADKEMFEKIVNRLKGHSLWSILLKYEEMKLDEKSEKNTN
jgi:hypothetical protein